MAEADATLRSGDLPAQGVEAARTIDLTSFKESQTSADVKQAFAEWSECMSEKGYEYASPLESAGDKWFAETSATAEEERVAQADVSCKNKVDLVDRWHKAESKIQQGMIDRHAKELERLRTFQDGLVKRSRDILQKE
ncbi:hypothetical protein [Streptomyces canus]|uniref:hypothetical protein n=1 Tax=Streptomyces canus TaxID=58343 RepID=UPI000377E61C|nr:hypothetical protein [Streptomyces canus]